MYSVQQILCSVWSSEATHAGKTSRSPCRARRRANVCSMLIGQEQRCCAMSQGGELVCPGRKYPCYRTVREPPGFQIEESRLAQFLPTQEGGVRSQLGQADCSARTKQQDCKMRDCEMQVRGAGAKFGSRTQAKSLHMNRGSSSRRRQKCPTKLPEMRD